MISHSLRVRGYIACGLLILLVEALYPASVQAQDPVLIAAGDIAGCDSTGDEATAALLDSIPGTIAALGDNVYQHATAADFANCYEPSWGRHKARTRPIPGNHEYHQPNAGPYFDYFGASAGPRDRGYYSYNLGAWHIVALNNYVDMSVGSAQERWLRADLAANPARCTLAYWHAPRWTSGSGHGNATQTQPLWKALHDYGVDLLLSGHEHNYERFAPQDAAGKLDTVRGVRQFVVGTGGKSVYGFGTPQPNSQVRNSNTYGVLKLTLHAESYDYRFVPIQGQRFNDYGRTTCSPTVTTTTPPKAFTVEADTRLTESIPATNYGTQAILRANGAEEPDEQTVLRVTVSGATQPIASARLRLYAVSPTTRGPTVYRTTNTWSETGVTWNTRPLPSGSALAARSTISANTWVEYNVTAAVTGNGTYSFVLVGSSTDGVDFSSREGSYRPQLVVTFR